MDPIPHIDIAEEARIEALLAAPENHSWPAIDCESMDGWVPDLGLTGYANYSIYRPPAVAAAGITTTVRHRFRVPPRNPKLPGPYYLAALLYDKAGEEFPLELSLGSEDVGRIEPRRHDNRRHLIVIDRPILFDDRVKWVQFASDGRGECRIERFVLLAEARGAQRVRAGHRAPARGGRRFRRRGCRHRPLPDLPAVDRHRFRPGSGRGDGRGVRSGRPRRPCTRSHLPVCRSTGPGPRG